MSAPLVECFRRPVQRNSPGTMSLGPIGLNILSPSRPDPELHAALTVCAGLRAYRAAYSLGRFDFETVRPCSFFLQLHTLSFRDQPIRRDCKDDDSWRTPLAALVPLLIWNSRPAFKCSGSPSFNVSKAGAADLPVGRYTPSVVNSIGRSRIKGLTGRPGSLAYP